MARSKPPKADASGPRHHGHSTDDDDSPGREWTRYWIRHDRDREKLPRAKPPAERIQTQERLAKAFFGCGSVAFAAFVRPFLHGTAQAYFAGILFAIGVVMYLCALLLHVLAWRHREPSRDERNEPGVEASRPQAASGAASGCVAKDRSSQDAPLVIPNDAPADSARPAPGLYAEAQWLWRRSRR